MPGYTFKKVNTIYIGVNVKCKPKVHCNSVCIKTKAITVTESYMVSPWKSHNKFTRILYQPKEQTREEHQDKQQQDKTRRGLPHQIHTTSITAYKKNHQLI